MARQDRNHFSSEQRHAIYDVIYARRDIRSHFLPDAIEPEVLCRVLDAAHHAGLVGSMRPWNFLVVTERLVRQRIHEVFLAENEKAATRFEGGRSSPYRTLKLEGILESPANICVTCDHTRHGPEVLGRNTIRETDLYSTCAIENLWLAARAEGLGVGWVSILDPRAVKTILSIPAAYRLVAYLCIGYVRQCPQEPELQRAGWLQRAPLSQIAFAEQWGKVPPICADDSTQSEKTS